MAILALIVGIGIAYAASSERGLPGGERAVWGGGHADIFAGREFSIVATPDGGEFLYGKAGSAIPAIGGDVTCVRVSGNHAVIGGIIRENGVSGTYVGWPFLWYVTDNGKLAATTPDQVSAGYIVDPPSIAEKWGGLTRSFPYVCPPFSDLPTSEPLYDLTGGDIVVQNAVQNAQQ